MTGWRVCWGSPGNKSLPPKRLHRSQFQDWCNISTLNEAIKADIKSWYWSIRNYSNSSISIFPNKVKCIEFCTTSSRTSSVCCGPNRLTFFSGKHFVLNLESLSSRRIFSRDVMSTQLTTSNLWFFFQLSVGVEDGVLQAYNQDFELQFTHRVVQMTRFSQSDLDPCTFLYLLREDNENLLYCYLYHAKKAYDVSISRMRK